jgi:hypothetical protein
MQLTQQEQDARAVGVCTFISDDWGTWHFQSTDEPQVYHTVHLDENDTSGACSCPHFDIRIRVLLRDRIVKPHTARAKCKHILRAEKILCYRVKKNLFALRNQNPNQNPK